MRLYLRTGLFAAVWGHDLIFLDVKSGRYQLLAGVAGHDRLTASGAYLSVGDPELAAFLDRAGLLGSSWPSEQHDPPLRPNKPALTLAKPVAKTVKRRFASAIAKSYVEMPLVYVGRSLPFLLSHARAPSDQVQRLDTVELVRAFHAAAPWLPVQGACVFRSFMLMRLLTRFTPATPRWVFGVRSWPFHAHCWVQDGEVALSDQPESLLRYTPIYAA